MKAITMDILLATHGRPDLLEQTLTSLLSQTAPEHLGRIIVVENGGDCDAASIVRALNRDGLLQFISVPEANKSKALNTGLQHCAEGLIFMTDDDVIVDRQLLEAYARESQLHPAPGSFFGGATKSQYEVEPADWMTSFLPVSARERTPAHGAELLPGKSFLGCNWAAYKSDLIAADGFDARFGPGGTTGATGQESQMQRRLRSIGAHGWWVKDAVVTHVVPANRCSPEWISSRAYRRGIESAIVAARADPTKAAAKLQARTTRARLRGLAAALLGGEMRRFRHKYWSNWEAGYKRGLEFAFSEERPRTVGMPHPADNNG